MGHVLGGAGDGASGAGAKELQCGAGLQGRGGDKKEYEGIQGQWFFVSLGI